MLGLLKRIMPDLVERTAASAFKPVEDGYLFQPMIGWRLGQSPCYLVNEAQKAAITARVTKNVEEMQTFLIVYLAACVVVVAARLLFTQWDLFTAMMAAVVGLGMAFVIALQVYARRTIGPLLDGLPIVEERISLNDRLEQQSKALSSTFFLTVGLAMVVIALVAASLDLGILAIALIGMAAWYFWLVFLRWRAARNASSSGQR